MFELFGTSHLATLAVLGLGIGAAWRTGRHSTVGVRTAVAALLVGGLILHFRALGRTPTLWDALPLHLCDLSIFLALAALARPRDRLVSLLFFWTTTGTLLACVTPALRSGFPSPRYLAYFALHGGVILAAVHLARHLRLTLRPQDAWRAWLLTNLYGGLVLLVDVTFQKNYLYLLRKPAGTLLDAFGPWPIYVIVVDLLGLALFVAVAALHTRLSRAAHPRAAPPLEGALGNSSL